jgi:hypothetical protein
MSVTLLTVKLYSIRPATAGAAKYNLCAESSAFSLQTSRVPEMKFIYQNYAAGAREIEDLPSMPKWKKSDPRTERKMNTLRAYLRSRSSPVEQSSSVVVL